MADAQAQHIVNAALHLRKNKPREPAMAVLDQALRSHEGSSPNFELRHPEYDDHTDPAAPFGELLRQAFAPAIDVLRDPASAQRWQQEVLEPFAQRYRLWEG